MSNRNWKDWARCSRRDLLASLAEERNKEEKCGQTDKEEPNTPPTQYSRAPFYLAAATLKDIMWARAPLPGFSLRRRPRVSVD